MESIFAELHPSLIAPIDLTQVWNVIGDVAVVIVPAVATYVGKKAIDVLADLMKQRLIVRAESTTDDKLRTVILYAADGSEACRVQVPIKQQH